MKKNVLGIAAVLVAISLSAFTSSAPKKVNKSATRYIWFQTKTGEGADPTLNDAQVIFLAPASSTPPSGSCPGLPTYNCVVGFDSTQVTGGTHINGTQPIMALGNKRGTL